MRAPQVFAAVDRDDRHGISQENSIRLPAAHQAANAVFRRRWSTADAPRPLDESEQATRRIHAAGHAV